MKIAVFGGTGGTGKNVLAQAVISAFGPAGTDARLNPAKSLAHADAAEFLLRAATEPEWVRRILDVGY